MRVMCDLMLLLSCCLFSASGRSVVTAFQVQCKMLSGASNWEGPAQSIVPLINSHRHFLFYACNYLRGGRVDAIKGMLLLS